MSETENKPEMPERPPESVSKVHGSMKTSLFGQSGPVGLSSANRGYMALGDIQGASNPGRAPFSTGSIEIELQDTPVPPTSILDRPAYEDTQAQQQPAFVKSAPTSWSPGDWRPHIDPTSFVHPDAVVAGNVEVAREVFISAGVVIRADNEEPIYIGEQSNIQETAILRDLPTFRDGRPVTQRIVEAGGKKFSLYIGSRVSVTPQSQIHGPAYIGDNVYLGMQSLVFWARIESGVIIEPGALIMNVTVPSGVFIPAGLKVTSQSVVKDLPKLTKKYRFHGIGGEAVQSNLEMLEGYKSQYR